MFWFSSGKVYKFSGSCMWSTQENVNTTRALEKNVYSAVSDETVCISINLIWADVIFKASCLIDVLSNELSTDVSGMLVSYCYWCQFLPLYLLITASRLEPIMVSIYLNCYILLLEWSFFIMLCPPLSLITIFASKSICLIYVLLLKISFCFHLHGILFQILSLSACVHLHIWK